MENERGCALTSRLLALQVYKWTGLVVNGLTTLLFFLSAYTVRFRDSLTRLICRFIRTRWVSFRVICWMEFCRMKDAAHSSFRIWVCRSCVPMSCVVFTCWRSCLCRLIPFATLDWNWESVWSLMSLTICLSSWVRYVLTRTAWREWRSTHKEHRWEMQPMRWV